MLHEVGMVLLLQEVGVTRPLLQAVGVAQVIITGGEWVKGLATDLPLYMQRDDI